MNLADLAAYARRKYQISEQRKWTEFPGFSVLTDPKTGKWAALLMRQWDEESGTAVELCDIRCGIESLSEMSADYLSPPFRMRGSKWVGVRMGDKTDAQAVCGLLDRALGPEKKQGFTIVLENKTFPEASPYQETPLQRPGLPPFSHRAEIYEKIHKARRLYPGKGNTYQQTCKNFYFQGMYLKDCEDDEPLETVAPRYFPTYFDLSVRELRGYFTWRTQVRKGVYRRTNDTFVLIYLYELLNQIGTDSVQESLRKMEEFEKKYLDAGYGDEHLRRNLRRWTLELCILNDHPPEEARQYLDAETLSWDRAAAALKESDHLEDEAVFAALADVAGKKLLESAVLQKQPTEGRRLFARAWRAASRQKTENGKTLFTLCFGDMKPFPWHPLGNAVYWNREKPRDREYILSAGRIYICASGDWQVKSYQPLYFDRKLFMGFLHEADRQFRLYLKTGRPLREKTEELWAEPVIRSVIAADEKERAEAARPKVTLNLDGLDRIRQDALTTRDSLLTEEELREMSQSDQPAAAAVQQASPTATPAVQLEGPLLMIVQALLSGKSPRDMIQSQRLMPALIADAVNEAFFGEIGDTVMEETDEGLSLVEDYIEDIKRLLGGSIHE